VVIRQYLDSIEGVCRDFAGSVQKGIIQNSVIILRVFSS
jgi:hypothetical protein